MVDFCLVLAGIVAIRCWMASDPATVQHSRRLSSRKTRLENERSYASISGEKESGNLRGDAKRDKVNQGRSWDQKSCDEHEWKSYVRSEVVQNAWETLCGSIVQEFVYDTWYSGLSPDKEFPAEVRRILNIAFGYLSERARKIDLCNVMHDLSELLMEQVELYRDTRESILGEVNMPLRNRKPVTNGPVINEAALKERLAVDGNLHPALSHPSGDYKMIKAVSDGLVRKLLRPSDYEQVVIRSIARELLASCVLRPLMMWATPYYVNKAVYRLLEGYDQPIRLTPPGPALEARTTDLRGNWEFEQRIHQTVEEETRMLEYLRGHSSTKSPFSPRYGFHHNRSRSCDDFLSWSTEKFDNIDSAIDSGSPILNRRPSIDSIYNGSRSFLAYESFHQSINDHNLSPETEKELMAQNDLAFVTSLSQSSQMNSVEERPLYLKDRAKHVGTALPHVKSCNEIHDNDLLNEKFYSQLADLDYNAAKDHVNGANANGHFVSALPKGGISTVRSLHLNSTGRIGTGFIGIPRAKIVAADLVSTGAKDFVVYKIRVKDGSGFEWTVSRRYRHFEVLHRQLRSDPAYRLKLPPKRIFFHSQNFDFVEERRKALDTYLQCILVNPKLSFNESTWEFLKPGSERFEDCLHPREHRRGLGREISRKVFSVMGNALEATSSVGQGVVDSVFGGVIHDAKSGLGNLRSEKSAMDFEPELIKDRIYESTNDIRKELTEECIRRDNASNRRMSESPFYSGSPAHSKPTHYGVKFSRPDRMIAKAGSGIFKTATNGARKVRDAFMHADNWNIEPEHGEHQSGTDSWPRSQKYSSEETKPSDPSSRKITTTGFPFPQERNERDLLGKIKLRPDDSAEKVHKDIDLKKEEQASSSVRSEGVPFSVPSSETSTKEKQMDSDYSRNSAPSWVVDISRNISAPLYEIIDCLFQLQTRGFFRRHVYAVARQVLSMVMGDAIDIFLLSKLHSLKQESTIARIIHSIQTSLWPGGIWFQYTPRYLATRPDVVAARMMAAHDPVASVKSRFGDFVSPEEFLKATGPSPLDEEEVRSAVQELLLSQAPTPLLRLIGRNPYNEGVQDLYEMMQSPSFIKQLGYGILEIVTLHLCPDLKDLFRQLEHSDAFENMR